MCERIDVNQSHNKEKNKMCNNDGKIY